MDFFVLWAAAMAAVWLAPIVWRKTRKELARVRMRHPPKPRHRSEPIIAVRTWRLNWEFKLASLVRTYVWDGPTVRNPYTPTFNWHMGMVGPETLHHGFYAYNPGHFLRNWEEVVLDGLINNGGVAAAVGVVSLYGTVIEHEQGYRAQAARVDRLWLLTYPWTRYLQGVPLETVVNELSRMYDCPCSVILLTGSHGLDPAVREAVKNYLRERVRTRRKAG